MQGILKTYRKELTDYYKIYEQSLYSAIHIPITEPTGKDLHGTLKSLAGGLGARIGKAGQRAKRALVFRELLNAKENGADLTFHKVQHIGAATTGSRFISKEVIKHFSTKGRTARRQDRTQMTDEETEALIHAIAPQVEMLNEALIAIREQKNKELNQSPSYQALQKKTASLLAQ